jgi:hypothetical protein
MTPATPPTVTPSGATPATDAMTPTGGGDATSTQAADSARSTGWQLVIAAVTAGCPIPAAVSMTSTGSLVCIDLAGVADLTRWAKDLDAEPVEVREFAATSGRWLRATRADIRRDGLFVALEHVVRIPNPISAETPDAGRAGDEPAGGVR